MLRHVRHSRALRLAGSSRRRIFAMQTMYLVSPIILDEHTLLRWPVRFKRGAGLPSEQT
jgi:hypothetical protein